MKAFKRPDGPLDVVTNAGHDARFEDRRVCPVPFLLRHYPIRSPEHGARKVLAERLPRFAEEERAMGWHVQDDELVADGGRFIWDEAELTPWDPAAVRAETLAHATDRLLLAAHTRGDRLDRVGFDEDGLRRHVEHATGAQVPDPLLHEAGRLLDDLYLGVLDGVPHTDCDQTLRSLAAVEAMAADLRLLNDVLARTPLAGRYWLFGGLVLAWAREGALMPHDVLDADFAVLAEDMPRLEAAFGASGPRASPRCTASRARTGPPPSTHSRAGGGSSSSSGSTTRTTGSASTTTRSTAIAGRS